MRIPSRNRGVLCLGLGVFLAAMFLVGGGVLTATNGGYWTLVFLAAYLCGLVVLGHPVYKSTIGATDDATRQKSKLPSPVRRFLPAILFPLSLVLPIVFFRSDAFATELGMHLFTIGMGVGLSLFVPLGLGMMHGHGEPVGAQGQ